MIIANEARSALLAIIISYPTRARGTIVKYIISIYLYTLPDFYIFRLCLFSRVSAVLQSKVEVRRLNIGSISRTLSASGLITSHLLSGIQPRPAWYFFKTQILNIEADKTKMTIKKRVFEATQLPRQRDGSSLIFALADFAIYLVTTAINN